MQSEKGERDEAGHRASPMLLSLLGQSKNVAGVARSGYLADVPDKCSVLPEVGRSRTGRGAPACVAALHIELSAGSLSGCRASAVLLHEPGLSRDSISHTDVTPGRSGTWLSSSGARSCNSHPS